MKFTSMVTASRAEAAAALGIPVLEPISIVARALGRSAPTIHRAIAEGKLRAVMIGGRYFTTASAVRDFVSADALTP